MQKISSQIQEMKMFQAGAYWPPIQAQYIRENSESRA